MPAHIPLDLLGCLGNEKHELPRLSDGPLADSSHHSYEDAEFNYPDGLASGR